MTKEELENINWTRRWRARHPFYRMNLFFTGVTDAKILGCDYQNIAGVCSDGMISTYYDEHEVQEKEKNSISYFDDKETVENYFNEWERNSQQLIKDIKAICEQREDVSSGGIADALKGVKKEFETLFATYDFSRPEYGVAIERKIKSYLERDDANVDDIDELYFRLTYPKQESTLSRESDSWKKIVTHARKVGERSEDVKEMVVKHVEKYGWIGMAEQPDVWGVDHYKTKLSSAVNEVDEVNEDDGQSAVPKVDDEDILWLASVAQRLTHIRLETRYMWVYASFLLRTVIYRIADLTSVDAALLESYYSLDEMITLLEGGQVEHEKIISRDDYAFIIVSGKLLSYTKGETEEILDVFSRIDTIENVMVLHGKPAYKGLVQAKVKIIDPSYASQQAEVDKMEEGDVLVTSMTRPHLIDAIKKAGAIITDEGGVLSHAAIISRELKKPCVIGTKIATEVLKDGDIVEVDAERGVVRKIEK